jgi:hypothetical protein
MRKLQSVSLSVIVTAAAIPLVSGTAVAASYERCIQGYKNVQSASYRERLKRDAAACKGYQKKYAEDKGDAIISDPCFGGGPVCKEKLGVFDTKTECGEVTSSKLGTPAQIKEAERVSLELLKNWNKVCPMAQ